MTYYRSVMTYVVENGGPQRITRISTDGGFIAAEGTGWTYKYMITDYLGHVRSVVAARRDADGWFAECEQRTDFYPYGMAHELGNLHVNRYLFGGKELQDHTIGKGSMLGFYDFHARYYNPMLGRWFNVDPQMQLQNPYVYCGNLPVMFIDPDGELFWFAPIIIAAVAVGVVNTVSGIISGDIQSVGHAFASFGVGAVASLTTYFAGPYAGAFISGFGNSVLSQGFNNGWNNINFGSAAVGGVTSSVAAGVGQYIGKGTDKLVGKVTDKISSPVISKALNSSVSNSISGFTVNTGISLAEGNSWSESLDAGKKGALNGAVVGMMSGSAEGLKYARENNINPWNGEEKIVSQAKSVGAAGKGYSKVLQKGHTIEKSTLRELGLTRQQAYDAIHALKGAHELRNDFHGLIMGNGDYVHPHTREVLDNIF